MAKCILYREVSYVGGQFQRIDLYLQLYVGLSRDLIRLRLAILLL